MSASRTELLVDVGLAAIERDKCDAVNDDPELRTAATTAALVDAIATERIAIDAYQAARP